MLNLWFSFFLFLTGFYEGSPGHRPLIGSGVAVIELFTSEGCSSCPPVDSVVSGIAAREQDNVFVLSYHVDYWDRKGWKDAYSNGDYTGRQQKYVEILHDFSTYTPQVIINGDIEFVGSGSHDLQEAIGKELAKPTDTKVELTIKNISEKGITVSYTCPMMNDQILYLALVQRQAETEVKGGENAGLRLQHRNIVRELRSCYRSKGAETLKFPRGILGKECLVIGFLQDTIKGTITGAAALKIS